MTAPQILSQPHIEEFRDKGFVVVQGFYDLKSDIEPIQLGVYKIIGILLRKHEIPFEQRPFTPETFDSGYSELISANRKFGAEVYDAVKQIPAFMRLASCTRHEEILLQ